jgi:hypothetical protein
MICTNPPDYMLRPPRKIRREDHAKSPTAPAFRLIQAAASRIRRAARKKASKPGAGKPSALYSQRCAIRVTYSQNRSHGQWRAHGKYLERESAQHSQVQAPEQELQSQNRFNASASGVPIAPTLARWQAEEDPRLWKLIISPENPCDLVALTRKTMAGMEPELGRLQWVAIVHRNTDHHHVHVVLRGINEHGQPLMIPREMIRRGIRTIAEHEATRQLGYRTPDQARLARENEIAAKRFTSLDLLINRKAMEGNQRVSLTVFPDIHRDQVLRRLLTLESFALASPDGAGTWSIEPHLDHVLRAMQRTADRQRILRDHGAAVSDPNLPFSAEKSWRHLEGRTLVHGEDDFSGKPYLILEGTDAKVHYVDASNVDIQTARCAGQLKVNSFARLHRRGRSLINIEDLGNAEKLLANPAHFREAADRLLHAGKTPPTAIAQGWLGRYQSQLLLAAYSSLSRAVNTRQKNVTGR